MSVFSDLNISFFRAINDLGKEFTDLNPVFVFIAEYMVYFLALGVVIYWFTRSNQNRMMVICGAITFILAEIVGKIAGKIHSNNQPFAELANVNKLIDHAVDNSFPSDHTMLFFAFCATFLLFKKRLGLFWITLAFIVALSRVWVGVHFPADVIVGAIISIISAVIVYRFVPQWDFMNKLIAVYDRAEQKILPAKNTKREQDRSNYL
ncbi:undecaprenyl-diphosphatase [Virgibacillus oceani]|uniref:Undecaprenyl-diphosphatase n=1 Tax=Virgibacillus oceani TaxID=1479511 RepID=A0A917HRL0_9BACI|nr:undecaprenyl-diphosphatase [Virgibacillus oceani]GGG86974.1 undecaprenyl-diphosphatase [Virgibacillus oceani]